MADVTPPVFVDAGDHWDISIAGATVDQCCFDYAVVLRMSVAAGTWELRIETPLVLTDGDGVEHLILPEEAVRLDAVLQVLRLEVAEATAYKDGALALRFGDGVRIAVAPDEGYEAWGLVGPGGSRLVSLPGGGVAIWS
jgi:hypothetical protein